MKKKANRARPREVVVAVILLLIALLYLLPIKEGTLNSYRFALTNGQMLPAFLNSIKASVFWWSFRYRCPRSPATSCASITSGSRTSRLFSL